MYPIIYTTSLQVLYDWRGQITSEFLANIVRVNRFVTPCVTAGPRFDPALPRLVCTVNTSWKSHRLENFSPCLVFCRISHFSFLTFQIWNLTFYLSLLTYHFSNLFCTSYLQFIFSEKWEVKLKIWEVVRENREFSTEN